MPRETPLTQQTIHAISDVGRALNVQFLRDGALDDEERAVLGLVRYAANRAAWADYGRRERQHRENYTRVSPRLLREARHIGRDFGPPDAA